MPRLSLVTACFNAARYVEEMVRSVRAQTFQSWEHVVVDDGSSDGSAEVVRRLMKEDGRLRLLQQPNKGAAAARNAGLRAVSPDAQYVMFPDADDVLEPAALEALVSHLDAHPEAGMAYGRYRLMFPDGRLFSREAMPDGLMPEDLAPPRLVPRGPLIGELDDAHAETPLPALMAFFASVPSVSIHRRSALESLQGFDESFLLGCEDKDLVVRSALQAPVHFVPVDVARYRRHPSSHSMREGVARGLRQLYQKWYQRPLPRAERRLVLASFAFDRRVAGHYQLRWSRDNLLAGRPIEAGRKLWEGLRKTVGWVVLEIAARLG